MKQSNILIDAASKSNGASSVVLRDEIYRIALTEENAKQLRETAETVPSISNWLSYEEASEITATCFGALRLFNGCRVIHMPSYLKGLWEACKLQAAASDNNLEWLETNRLAASASTSGENLADFDTIVLAAGSGLFSGSILTTDLMPVQLVKGQSVELKHLEDEDRNLLEHALLCGKYVSPLPDGRVLVGATHEFKPELLSKELVVEELKARTDAMIPDIWREMIFDRVTKGVRVQSKRGPQGRRPIIGRLPADLGLSIGHPNAWIFTGLSSRGLLYHGLYGKLLAQGVLDDCEDRILSKDKDVFWWR